MPRIHAGNLPPGTLDAVKRRTAARTRSRENDIPPVVARAASEAPPRAGCCPPIRLQQVEVGSVRSWSREELYGDDGR